MPKSSLTLVFLATTLFGASILGGCVRSRFIHRSPTDATTELSDTGLGVDQAHDILSIRPLDGKISDLWHHEEASDRDAIDLPAKDTAHDLPAKDTAHDLPAKDTAH
ncbi:MAG: hypothetical protein KAI66_19025, partial [Lentisphaeria bacterium]|nr:hypothetical protein [Lentisphaeria bacterium]